MLPVTIAQKKPERAVEEAPRGAAAGRPVVAAVGTLQAPVAAAAGMKEEGATPPGRWVLPGCCCGGGSVGSAKSWAKERSAVPQFLPRGSSIRNQAAAWSKSTVRKTETPSANFGREQESFVMLSRLRMQTCPCLFRNTDFIRWMLVRRILESKTKPTPSAAPTEPSRIVYR